MKVDASGLVAAAQRLVTAVGALAVDAGVPHPPLAADPASVGAAGRLTTAGAELSAALAAHVAALVASVEHLTRAAVTFVETDTANAVAIATLDVSRAQGAVPGGAAPPAPPVPPDVRAPMPPPVGMTAEAISAATHAVTPGAGEPFIGAWSAVSSAARGAAATIRATLAQLPEVLDAPASTPAVSRHLLSFAEGLDAYGDRAHTLASQAQAYATNHGQALEDIPGPHRLAVANNRVQTIAHANATSGGRWAVPLAQAVAERNGLVEQVLTGFGGYRQRNDAATAGDDSGARAKGPGVADPTTPEVPGDNTDQPDPITGALSPEAGGQLASLLPQMIPAVLGAAGGVAGGAIAAVAKLPQSLMQAGTQALGAAAQGLSGLAAPNMGHPDRGDGGHQPSPDNSGGPAEAGEGADVPTIPAGGAGAPELGIAPSTGAPPTPAIAPVGAGEGPAGGAPSAGAAGMTPMGMPVGGLGGAPGGGGTAKSEAASKQKIQPREIPHTEDVTGRVDINRLSAAAAASHRERGPEPPNDAPDSAAPVVRRLVTRPAKESS